MPPTATLFDSHTHLQVEAYDEDRRAVLERARRQGVAEMLVVGYDLPSSDAAVHLAREEEGLYASAGIQPHYADATSPEDLVQLHRLARRPPVVALGEIGLDYYRDRAPRPAQQQLLRAQLDMAQELDLPVVIHCRNAYDDMLQILRRDGQGNRGVMHCFSGTLQEAHGFLELGFYISIAGPVTYPRAAKTWEVAASVPLDRLLIETDCPWLPPQSKRGKRNEPAYLTETAERIAELRDMATEELARAVTANTQALFLNR